MTVKPAADVAFSDGQEEPLSPTVSRLLLNATRCSPQNASKVHGQCFPYVRFQQVFSFMLHLKPSTGIATVKKIFAILVVVLLSLVALVFAKAESVSFHNVIYSFSDIALADLFTKNVKNTSHMKLCTVTDELKQSVFYNRIPKAGSRSLLIILSRVGEHNKIHTRSTFVRMPFTAENLSCRNQPAFIKSFVTMKSPVLYDRHMYFLDFTQYGCPQPIYINMMREPVERLASEYYFMRGRKKAGRMQDVTMRRRRMSRSFDDCVESHLMECTHPNVTSQQLRFLCGHHSVCATPSMAAVARAIYNVKRHYLVVGYNAQMAKLVKVLESHLPAMFMGASERYQADVKQLKKKTSGKFRKSNGLQGIQRKTRLKLKQLMKYEYELYNFVKKYFASTYSNFIQS